jgi:hypothetical protein
MKNEPEPTVVTLTASFARLGQPLALLTRALRDASSACAALADAIPEAVEEGEQWTHWPGSLDAFA